MSRVEEGKGFSWLVHDSARPACLPWTTGRPDGLQSTNDTLSLELSGNLEESGENNCEKCGGEEEGDGGIL